MRLSDRSQCGADVAQVLAHQDVKARRHARLSLHRRLARGAWPRFSRLKPPSGPRWQRAPTLRRV